MNVEDIIGCINKPVKLNDGDYKGKDGLVYCGKCHTPKQFKLRTLIVYCLCECEEKARDNEKAKEEKAEIEQLRERCLPLKGYWQCTFDHADPGLKHIDIARNYVRQWKVNIDEGKGLLFWGNTGTGKTFTALCIANALIDKHIHVMFTTAEEIVSKMGGDRENTLGRVSRVPLLIIDDIGAERDTEFSREQLCAVINTRLASKKPLVVTTNYALNDLKNTPDTKLQRIYSRLQESCVFVSVVGEDRRSAIGAENRKKAAEMLKSTPV